MDDDLERMTESRSKADDYSEETDADYRKQLTIKNPQESLLQQDLNPVEDSSIRCENCDSTFIHKWSLARHLRRGMI